MFQRLRRAGSTALAILVAAGMLPAGAMAANAAETTTTQEAVLSVTEACPHDSKVLKSYTLAQLEELAKQNEELVSFMYLKNGVNICAVPEYVTLEQLFEDAGIEWKQYQSDGFELVLAAPGFPYTQDYAVLDVETKNDYMFYPEMTNENQTNTDGGIAVPACISLKYKIGTLGSDESAKTAGDYAKKLAESATEGLRTFSGTLATDVSGETNQGTTAGKRLVTDVNEVSFVKDPGLTKVEAKPATTTAAGNKEYYECGVCHKKFNDANGTTPVSDADVTIAKLPVPASETTVSLSKTSFTYNGQAQKPTVTVKDSSGKTIASSNYDVTYADGCKNAGTYNVTVKFNGKAYTGSVTKTFKIVRAAQTIKLPKNNKKTYTYKVSTLKKKAKTFSIKPTVKGSAKVTYKVTTKGAKKSISVNAKGKVTMKKGAKKGTYKITVKAAQTKNYKAASKTVTVKVK